MADEERKEDGTPDPWEGIDAENAGDPSPDIAFSFDDGVDEPALEPGLELGQPLGEALGEDEIFPAEGLDEGSGPLLQWDSNEDPVDGTPASEVPLAVFPPADHPEADAGDIDIGMAVDGGSTAPGGEASSISIQSSSIQIGTGRSGIVSIDEWADAAAESVVDAAVDAPLGSPFDDHGQPPASPNDSESFTDFSEGESAEEFPFEDAAFDDASQGIHAPAGDGDGQDGPDIGESFAAAEPAGGEFDQQPAASDPFATAFGDLIIESEQPSAEVESGVLETAAQAAIPTAAAAASKPPRKASPKPVKKKAKQGGIGQMIGVVLGGLMALPITYAILVWGFQKDPFKLTKMVPPDVAFLLPQKFQPGFKRQATSLPMPTAGSSLDDLPTVPPATDAAATGTEPAAPADGEPLVPEGDGGDAATADAVLADVARSADKPPADDAGAADAALIDETAAEPAPASIPAPPPAPEPLDLSGLAAAVKTADSAVDALLAVEDPTDPLRRKLLVGWYKTLAKVGEELTMLETVAADTGRPLKQTPEALAALQGKIAGSRQLVDDLGTLGRMWLSSQKRPADGVVLLGTFGSTRKVGPYWYTLVSLPEAEGAAVREVSIISRSEPTASEGDRVVATGVLFSGEIVWAADCRRLEAAKPAAVEDLF
jgi:cytoskeletal protein RodZ